MRVDKLMLRVATSPILGIIVLVLVELLAMWLQITTDLTRCP